MPDPATAWVVAGPPGAGKTTVAGLLLRALRPVPALLDKDTMYGSFVAAELGGEPVRLVWVRTDAGSLRRRLTGRGSPRDTAKLARFAEFCDRMRLGHEPAVPHTAIDNRLTAPVPLEAQIAALAEAL